MQISKLPLSAALSLMLLNGCTALDNDVTVGEAIDDTAITAQVKAKLIADDDLKARNINVDTRQGVVMLTGVVDNAAEIERVNDLIDEVDGVDSIQNNLTVDQ